MDYAAKGGDELTLKEGQHVKVYKKYCHWSYTWVGSRYLLSCSTTSPHSSVRVPLSEL
jgi:hypothetical protein